MWELDHNECWVQKNWWFWTVVLEKTFRVPWTARRSNQSILKETIPKYSLKGVMLKLKLQYFGHLCEELTHWKRHCSWERLKAGGEGDNRGWDGLMASVTWWTWIWAISGTRWGTEKPGVLQSMGSQRVRHDWATELNYILSLIWGNLPVSSKFHSLSTRFQVCRSGKSQDF